MKTFALMAVSGLILSATHAYAGQVNPIINFDRTAIGEENDSGGDSGTNGD